MSDRVFIPQVPMRVDGVRGMVPKFDTLRLAERFGEIVILIDSPQAYANRPECIRTIRSKLSAYSSRDYFLPMGSHFFMMIASIVISSKVSSINMLEWSVRQHDYIINPINVTELTFMGDGVSIGTRRSKP